MEPLWLRLVRVPWRFAIRTPHLPALALVLVVATVSFASAQLTLTRPTFGSGAGTATGSTLSLSYSVGQSVVGEGTSGALELESGFWAGRQSTVTAVDETPVLPAVFHLHPNTPNPFNPRTEIRFDLPQAVAGLTLEVFDLAGRRVATLAEGPHPAGRHSVVWNGADDDGRPVASGIYLYRLDSPVFRHTHKLALVR